MKHSSLPSEKDYLPHIAYDSVVFGFSGETLQILLIKYRNTGLYALPGGFVGKNEDLDSAVRRGLKERTGLENIYLEQFHTFGSMERYVPEVMKMILESGGSDLPKDYWMLRRFISIAYYALINHRDVNLAPDILSDHIDWYDIDKLPTLMLDHAGIVSGALESLRNHLDSHLAGRNLLPKKFTMNELQQVYEAILGDNLRRTSFQRKMLSLGILKRHGKKYTGNAHKAPYLYSFNEE